MLHDRPDPRGEPLDLAAQQTPARRGPAPNPRPPSRTRVEQAPDHPNRGPLGNDGQAEQPRQPRNGHHRDDERDQHAARQRLARQERQGCEAAEREEEERGDEREQRTENGLGQPRAAPAQHIELRGAAPRLRRRDRAQEHVRPVRAHAVPQRNPREDPAVEEQAIPETAQREIEREQREQGDGESRRDAGEDTVEFRRRAPPDERHESQRRESPRRRARRRPACPARGWGNSVGDSPLVLLSWSRPKGSVTPRGGR